ncbi:hypothetical protein [Streptomyces alkaliterrae]|uniref:Uncharacterized protein n=1 Tax=Streptomyces alkaliterrae TaxID=2213162 RepID=A0A5P0YQA8_9ACTN|nr:hypothetical protein [Streptomyces alkaliterrae]MBB1260167.1 hypothetical protein [Streptomyces alkaliterrae]MQS02090.1 hypothetical protein [Streptomyces alkaliterrae]
MSDGFPVTVVAAYDTDWHLFLTCPERGDLGYCTGVGPDEPFDPQAATRTLKEAGWKLAPDGWRETSLDEEYPFVAQVAREG